MVSSADISALIGRVALRDRTAFEQLYAATSAKLFGICLRVMKDRAGAEDVLQDAYLRWVIYVPFATPQTTGLSTKGSDGAPWLMSPGTAGAHIMISPPKAK